MRTQAGFTVSNNTLRLIIPSRGSPTVLSALSAQREASYDCSGSERALTAGAQDVRDPCFYCVSGITAAPSITGAVLPDLKNPTAERA